MSNSGRYTLKLRDIVIGWSNLEARDIANSVARGPFRPGMGWNLVEPIFALQPADPAAPDAGERQHRYQRARDTLALSLHAADGAMLDTARIDIAPNDVSPTQLELVVVVVDRGFWEIPG